jgi:hypothetical protein
MSEGRCGLLQGTAEPVVLLRNSRQTAVTDNRQLNAAEIERDFLPSKDRRSLTDVVLRRPSAAVTECVARCDWVAQHQVLPDPQTLSSLGHPPKIN